MTDDPRADLVARIETIRDRWHRLIADVGEDRMELPGAMGDWTFKDVASHLGAWRARGADRLAALGRGDPPPPAPWPAEFGDDEDDAINGWIHEETKDHPLAAALADTEASYDAFVAAIRAMPLDAATREAAQWAEAEIEDGHPYGHLGEHEPDVRRWLAGLDGGAERSGR